MSDPNFYRKYECNIECYKMKASKVFRCAKCELGEASATSVSTPSLTLDQIKFYTGSFPLGTTHTLTSSELPVLGNNDCTGELSFFLFNDRYVATVMAVVAKAKGVILQTLIYQRVGNYNTSALTFSGNTIILTTDPGSICKWMYRGI